jgi:hypothetical protein
VGQELGVFEEAQNTEISDNQSRQNAQRPRPAGVRSSQIEPA